MSRELIENTLSKKEPGVEVCAIVLHHTLGFVPDTLSIAELGIPVIEDISQSCGGLQKKDDDEDQNDKSEKNEKNEKETPAINGNFCILGLEERDMLTSGGGALLFAMNRRDSSALRNFSGIADEYCLPDINAALAVVQFRELHRNIERRKEIARVYARSSQSAASGHGRHKSFISSGEEENVYSFSLVLKTGLKDVVSYAKKKEILLENAFGNTIAALGCCDDCPVSNSLVLRTVMFPMYPKLRSTEVERVSRLITTLP
jgi:dTDP-4-amino-4,6-dideoxygalactose transaminase